MLTKCPGLIIVDVFTQWAGPCDVMKPIINKVKSSVKVKLIAHIILTVTYYLSCVSSCRRARISFSTKPPVRT